MEEARLTAYLFQKLLDAVFLTEHNMARQLGLSYKVLRRVQKAQRMTQKTADAMERLISAEDWPIPTYTDLLYRI